MTHRLSAARVLRALAVVAAVLVGGCGFHLEGRTPLPAAMRRPYLEVIDRQSDFVQSLLRALLIAGAHPTDNEQQATAVIHILKDQVVRQVLSTSASNQITEYTVTYNVRFSVTIGDREVLAPQDISNTEPYSFTESMQLAKQQEEIILREGMAHDLADVVMRRLARVQASS